MLDRGRVWRPLDGQTDPALAALVRRRRPAARARATCAAASTERMLADGSVLIAARRGPGAPAARGAASAATSRASRSACSTPTSTRRTSSGCASSTREVLGDDRRSRSRRRPRRWPRSTRARRRRSIDVFMKLIFTALRAPSSTPTCASSASTGELNFADCAATLLPWDEALEQPFRIVFAGPAAGTISSTRLGEALGDGNLLCADVGGTSTDVSLVVDGAAVRQQHVRARARPGHQRALDRDLERRRRRRQHRLDLAVRRRRASGPASAGADPGPGVLRPRRHGADRHRRLPADGHPRPGRLRRRRAARSTPSSRGARSRRSTRRSRFEQRVAFAYRIAAANIAEEVTNVADPPRRRPARLHARRLRRGRADAAARDARPAAGRGASSCRRTRACSRRSGLLSTDLVYYDSRSAYVVLSARRGAADRRPASPRWRSGCASASARRRRRGRAAASTGGCSARAGRRRSSRSPTGRSRPTTIGELVERFHAAYERRYGNRFPMRAGAGRHLSRAARRAGRARSSYDRARDGDGAAPAPAAHDRAALLRRRAARGRRVRARAAAGRRARRAARRSSASRLSTTFVCPGQVAEVGRFGEIVDRAGGAQ